MLLHVLGDQAIRFGVDVLRARGERCDQLLGDARDRPRRVAVAAHLALLPLDPERAGHVVCEHRLVQLTERDHGRVHRPPVQRPPPAVQRGLDLVADDHVGVQVRVARARVEVVERGCHQPGHIDLRNRAVRCGEARACRGDLAFHERHQLRNRRMMRLPDERLHVGIRDRPERRCRLRDREREVEPGDRAALRALGFLALDPRHLRRPHVRPEVRIECGDALLDPLARRRVARERAAERVARDRVAAHADEELELRLRHPIPGRQLAPAERGDGRAHPVAGRCTRLTVVPRQRRRERPVTVGRRDGAQQVLVAVPGTHHPHRHRHHATALSTGRCAGASSICKRRDSSTGLGRAAARSTSGGSCRASLTRRSTFRRVRCCLPPKGSFL